MTPKDQIVKLRDAKMKPHLAQYAPVWIANEEFDEEDDSVLFSAIFQHHQYGWVDRRYRYDGFNNVLYHKGQIQLDEEAALEYQEKAPYIDTTIADIPNAYGG